MTADELCARLLAMPPQGVEVLSRAHFEAMFGEHKTFEGRKRAALSFGERCGCDVTFVGTDNMFVRFMRKAD